MPTLPLTRLHTVAGGMAQQRYNPYENPYGSGKRSAFDRFQFLNSIRGDFNSRERRPRHFAHSRRGVSFMGGHRFGPFQRSYGQMRNPIFGQPRRRPFSASPFATQIPRFTSPPYTSMPRRSRFPGVLPRGYGTPFPRFNMPPITRGYPHQRPYMGRARRHSFPQAEEDDEGSCWDEEDDDWPSYNESETETTECDFDDDEEDEDYYTDDYSSQGAPFNAYGGFSPRYNGYDEEDYDGTSSMSYYGGYPRPPHQRWQSY